jgi:hypothetical protein
VLLGQPPALHQQRHLVGGLLVLRRPTREEPIQQGHEELAHRQGEDGGLKGGVMPRQKARRTT